MTTDLDRLQAAWADLDRRVAAHDDALLLAGRASAVHSLRRKLRPLVFGQWAQVLMGLALAVLGGSVWPDADTPLAVGSAIAVHLYGIASIAWGGVTLGRLARLDYAAPVVELQSHLLRVQRGHLLGSLVLGLAWWVLWIPFLVTLFAALGGDYHAHVGPAMRTIAGACTAGLVVTVIAGALAWRNPTLRGRLQRTLLGARLHAAGEELADLAAAGHG